MGQRIRAFDWSDTGLGPLGEWPQSLKSVTALLLLSPVPIVLLWGEKGIMIYNDAYSGFAGGRHPGLLGSEVRKGWPEVADFNDNVMKVGLAGGTLAYKDQELTLHRHGRPEQVWMNLDYSPVLDESGRPAGVIAIVVETTEHVLAVRHMQAERSRLARLFEQAPGMMAMVRGTGHVFELANHAFMQLIGDRHVLGRPLREALPDVARQGFVQLLDRVYASGTAFVGTATKVSLQRELGAQEEWRVLDFVCQPMLDAGGQVSGIFIEGHDITERSAAEALVQSSEERFRVLVNATSDVVYRMDPDWTRLQYLEGKGFISDTISPRNDWLDAYVDAEDQPAVSAAIRRAIADKSIFQLEHRVRRVDGSPGWMLSRAIPLLDEHGRIVEWFGTASDITARRQAEESLRQNEARLRFLDAFANETARASKADEILGITTRMLGRHLRAAICAYADVAPDGDLVTVRGDWTATGSSSIVGRYSLASFGEVTVQQLRAGRPLVLDDISGELAPEVAARYRQLGIAATVSMPLIKQGQLTALMAVHDKVPREWQPHELALVIEVTERSWAHIERVRSEEAVRQGAQRFRQELEAKVAERTAALERSEANIRTIFESSHLYQGLMSVDGVLRYANATALAGIEAELADVVGRPFWETPWFTGTPGMPERVRAAVARVAAGDTENLSLALQLPTGLRLFDFSLRPVKDENGEVVAMVPEAVEKTARVKAEQALQQVQKMEALGNLTGGIAHDFNNLLMAVLGSLEMLRRRMPEDPPLLRLLDIAKAGADRGASLTRRMLAFARRQDLKPERIDPRRLIEGMTELLQRSLGATIRVETRFPKELPAVEADANQLESALLNLAVNARDAMHGEGSIVIEMREESVASSDGGLKPGRYVCLSVTDFGEGMDEATLKRATEPFFTTKGVGKGTGLGLSMVHGLAEQSGGVLRMRSEPGSGTTAEIWLPALPDATPVAINPVEYVPEARRSAMPSAAVLVVDDDDLVLMNTVEMLEDLGYQVIPARSGRQALGMLQHTPFDLLITDHAMPHMTGAQLVAEVRKLRPALPIILATGYAELPPGLHAALPRLSKPFSQAMLADAVAKVIDQR
ncbi:PAS domain-containing protein [Dyella jejuensis]|uniref:histidine kinase n=1 Tax=Dyella jejuensis TaxID=1432009 RepID=A0ABW8JK65_9GAMM